MSRLVQSLVKRGWLKKENHPTDGRAQQLTLTPDGTKKAAHVARARKAKFEALTRALPKPKREAVLSALAMLTEAVYEAEKVH